MRELIVKAVMLIAFLSASLSSDAHDFEVDGILYTINKTPIYTCHVSGLSSDVDELVIPGQVPYKNRDLKVTAVGDSVFFGSKIQRVVLPEIMESLGNYCFSGSNIRCVENTESLIWLGRECFKDCKFLEKFVFGQKKEVTMGGYSFYGCSSLESITIPSNVKWSGWGGNFANCSGLREVLVDTWLDSSTFSSCSSLVSVVFGENCTGIDSYCFYDCKKLVDIKIPSTVRKLGQSCFEGCSSLKSIKIPESVNLYEGKDRSYGDRCIFRGCTSLENVEWNANIIPVGTFENCFSLTTLIIGGNTSSIYLGSVPDEGVSSDRIYTFGCNIRTLKILQSENPLKFYIEIVKQSNPRITTHAKDVPFNSSNLKRCLLQIYTNVHELYIARRLDKLGGLYDYKPLNNLNCLVFGPNCPKDLFKDLDHLANWEDLKSIKSERTVPPYLYDRFTMDQYTSMDVEVPMESLNLYRNAIVWGNFWNLRGFSSVKNVLADDPFFVNVENGCIHVDGKGELDVVEIFNVHGQLIMHSTKNIIDIGARGVYLVKIGSYCKKIML